MWTSAADLNLSLQERLMILQNRPQMALLRPEASGGIKDLAWMARNFRKGVANRGCLQLLRGVPFPAEVENFLLTNAADLSSEEELVWDSPFVLNHCCFYKKTI